MRRHLKLLQTAHLDQLLLLLWDLPLGASALLGDQSSAGGTSRARRRLALVWRVPTILPDGPLELKGLDAAGCSVEVLLGGANGLEEALDLVALGLEVLLQGLDVVLELRQAVLGGSGADFCWSRRGGRAPGGIPRGRDRIEEGALGTWRGRR